MDPAPESPTPSRLRPACPHCGRAANGYLRYAFSSWLFPVRCAACGSRFYLGYHPVVFLLVWMLLSPLYLFALFYLALLLLPGDLMVAGFLPAILCGAVLLPLVGTPRLKSPPAA